MTEINKYELGAKAATRRWEDCAREVETWPVEDQMHWWRGLIDTFVQICRERVGNDPVRAAVGKSGG